MCQHYAKSKGGSHDMSEGHTVKLDRNAFNRGFEDMITLRPLRDAVTAAVKSASKSGEVIAHKPQSTGQTSNVRKRYTSGAK